MVGGFVAATDAIASTGPATRSKSMSAKIAAALRGADLTGTSLSQADLRGATMPDGQPYDG
ncbi:hypothetical protein XM38_009630 [Halomicronema hongdechloris C2206]|uniref:Pentapeptide repeat-containing protein n=1 Tax=Halomicronema hongdechloris C2206 TaxID=1641165 RepID=A0A1Z3HID2_9CYAN|nr:pentapeptide repeat-containing protein [Halomicronema hongdechloris]ASC70033.1 hypothetical protein XM38_009630 [Halomicronema hongdechloris C2206]